MNAPRATFLPIFLLACLTPCFAHHMAVVVNPENPVAKVTSTELAKIFRFESATWPDGQSLVLVLHKDSPGENETLQKLLKLNSVQCRSLIAAHQNSVRIANSDADVISFVQSTPGAIGLIEVHSLTNKVKVVSVDAKLPMEAGYLSH